MTLYKKREKFSGFSAQLGKVFGSIGSANHYTLLALLLVFASVYFLVLRQFAYAAMFFAIASFFDVVDGAVARHQNKASRLGAYFDSVSDRYVEGIFAAGLILAGLPGFIFPAEFWIIVFLFGSVMTTYARAVAAEKAITKDLRGGLLERSERLMLLFIGIVLALFNLVYLVYVIALLAVLTNISALQRIHTAISLVKNNGKR